MYKSGKFHNKLGIPQGELFPVAGYVTDADLFYREDLDRAYIRVAGEWLQFSRDNPSGYSSLVVGIPPNYLEITASGYLRIYGEGTVWDDLRFPAQGINPPGQVSDPDLDITDGTWLFDNNSTEILMGIAQMAHNWREGSAIYPHIHWSPTNTDTGDVRWQLDYQIASFGGTFPGSWTTLNIDDPGDGTDDKYQVATFSAISMTGHTLSCMIKWKVSRIGGSDTYNADAKFLEFDIHYEIDSFGSNEQYIK